jgi:hypothetical protein
MIWWFVLLVPVFAVLGYYWLNTDRKRKRKSSNLADAGAGFLILILAVCWLFSKKKT